VVTTVIGAVLGLMISKWDTWRETAKRGDLRGEWLALSHGGDHDAVYDKIVISKSRGKLCLRNIGNPYGYSYEAFCVVESYNILHGSWRSLRTGSALTGRVLMMVDPQGTSILGAYTGKNNEGRDLLLIWTLARDADSLKEAADRARTSVLLFKTPTSPILGP
jgi:hypothetical protein